MQKTKILIWNMRSPVPTVEALLALNLKDSAVIVAVIIIVNYILTLYENCMKILIFKIIYKTPLNV